MKYIFSDDDDDDNSTISNSNSSSNKSSDNSDIEDDEDDDNDEDLDNYQSILLMSKNDTNHIIEKKFEHDNSIHSNNIDNKNIPFCSSFDMKETLEIKHDNTSKKNITYEYDSSNNRKDTEEGQEDKRGPLLITNPKEVVDEILREEKKTSSETIIGYALSKYSKESVESLSMFKEEIILILQMYAKMKCRQQLLGNFNTNSTNYSEEMVKKMIEIISRIDKNSMALDKYRDVVREALYIYHLVVSKMTGPKHLKRLRTPDLHFDFCVIVALLAHNIEVNKSNFSKYRATSLIQFVSALDCQWYLSVVPNILSVFNSSSSICQIIGFSALKHAKINIILCLLFNIFEKKPNNLVLATILYLYPESLNVIKQNGLIRDEASVIALSKKIKIHLDDYWIYQSDIHCAANLLIGQWTEGLNIIKLFKKQHYDKKVIAISLLVQQRLKQLNQTVEYY
nr:MAG: wsv282-like protein [Metapenaeopsis lamellata majanivirus]